MKRINLLLISLLCGCIHARTETSVDTVKTVGNDPEAVASSESGLDVLLKKQESARVPV